METILFTTNYMVFTILSMTVINFVRQLRNLMLICDEHSFLLFVAGIYTACNQYYKIVIIIPST